MLKEGIVVLGSILLLSGCASPSRVATDAQNQNFGQVQALAWHCKKEGAIDDATIGLMMTAVSNYTGVIYDPTVVNTYYQTYVSQPKQGQCAEIYAFIEKEKQYRANNAAQSKANQEAWNNINSTPVYTPRYCYKSGMMVNCF